MDPSLYQAACDSFKKATDMLNELLGQIETQLASFTKAQRNQSFLRSSLQAKLSLTETKLKVTSDELSIQSRLKTDTNLLMERVTTLQKENVRLLEEKAQQAKSEETLKQRILQLSSDLDAANAKNEAMKQAWKDAIRDYEAQIDLLRAQKQPNTPEVHHL